MGRKSLYAPCHKDGSVKDINNEARDRGAQTAATRPLLWHVRNVVSGLLVPSDDRRTPRTFHWAFDAAAWVEKQDRPQDFEVVQADA